MKFIGIDWAHEVHDVAILDESGGVQERWRVRHDAGGVGALLERLAREGGPPEILVGIESGAPLLLDQLLAAGYTLYCFNPKQADRYRDRHSVAGAKDDRLDAIVVADAVRTDRERLRPLQRDSDLAEEMRIRDRARTRKVEQRVRLCNQLRQLLTRYFPAVLALGRDMHDSFLLELLRAYPDPRAARAGRMPKLERLLSKHRIRAIMGTESGTESDQSLSIRRLAQRGEAPGHELGRIEPVLVYLGDAPPVVVEEPLGPRSTCPEGPVPLLADRSGPRLHPNGLRVRGSRYRGNRG
jgi:transposase